MLTDLVRAAAQSPEPRADQSSPKLWRPRRVLVTPAALEWEHGRAILERAAALGSEIVELKSNRLTGLSGENDRKAYVNAKTADPTQRGLARGSCRGLPGSLSVLLSRRLTLGPSSDEGLCQSAGDPWGLVRVHWKGWRNLRF